METQMMYFGGHMSGWGWVGAMVGMLFFWGLLIVLAAVAYRALTGRGAEGQGPAPSTADPRRILAERFARGEIDEDEYRGRLAALDDAGTTTRTAA
jgi:putative membrane protein